MRAIDENGFSYKHFKQIYHEKPEMKKENVSGAKANTSFLDTDLDIKDNKIPNIFPILILNWLGN